MRSVINLLRKVSSEPTHMDMDSYGWVFMMYMFYTYFMKSVINGWFV